MASRTADIITGVIVAALIAGATPVTAQEEGASAPEDHAFREPAPTMELLEFLGEWETEDGHWIDPTRLEPTPADDAEMENETQNDDERPSRD